MFGTRRFRISAISSMLCVMGAGHGLIAADADADLPFAEEPSVAQTGEWSEASIAKGQNKEIDEKTIADLPPNLRQIWASKPVAADRKANDRRKTLSNRDLVDEIIPAYGVQYITDQRNFSRAEPLWHKVHKFLTDVNIRVMAGELGRRGPMLVDPAKVKGEKAVQGDVALKDQGVLPEETQIAAFHDDLVKLRQQISYPNLLERDHFNEIAGDLAKAQGLINYDLTEDGIKRIDEQFAAWRILIEAARLQAIEMQTNVILEENPTWDRVKAGRQAESSEIEFKFPALPMGEHALRDARAELNRMHEVRTPAKEINAKAKERTEAAAKEKQPEIIKVKEVEETADTTEEAEWVLEEEATPEAKEEMAEEAVEEATEEADPIEETTPAAKEMDVDLDVEVEDINLDEEEAPKKEMPKAEVKEEEAEEDAAPSVDDDFIFE